MLFIFLLPLLRKTFAARHQKQEDHLRQEEVAEEEFSPPLTPFAQPTPMVPRTEEERFEFHSRLEAKKKKKKHLRSATDPLSTALKGKMPLQAMMLASQILGEPKSLQDD